MSWNDLARKRGLETRLKNKTKTEIRYCICGCNLSFRCRITQKRTYFNHKHYIMHIKSVGRPKYVCDKISEFQRNKLKIAHENRICICGCGKIFECKVNSTQKYVARGHAVRDINNINITNARMLRVKKIKGKHPWNYGLTKETDKRVAKNVKAFQRLNQERKNKPQPDYLVRKRIISSMRKTGKHPNNFELKCRNLLNIYYPNEFEYCGNGTKVINGKCPDFIHKNKKIVVLCNGTYWHLNKNGFNDTLENRHFIELYDSEPYRSFCYEVWIIWEDRILDINKTIVLNSNNKEVKQNDNKEICTIC